MSRSRYESQIRKVLDERTQDNAVDFDGVPFTWGEARSVTSAIERALDEAGLADTEKVGLMGRNRPAHFAALWGIFVAGRCASMVQALQPEDGLVADIEANRWPVLIGERRDWTPKVIAAANSAGSVGYAFTDKSDRPLERVSASAQPGPKTDRSKGETALQLLSSGTTGKPKRISLSRTAVDEMIERTIQLFEMAGPAAKTTLILPWPLASLGGTNGALPAAALGQQLAIQEKFNAERMLEMIKRYRPPFLGIPPSALGMLLHLKPKREDFSSVKMLATGSAPLDPNVQRVLEQDYGVPCTVTYGATEFCGVVSGWTTPDMVKFLASKKGSSGRALPGIQIRIVSAETGQPLPAGESGFVEALVPRIGPDWIRTNDLAHMDEDGFLYLEGRADDAILRGGFKVIPEEVAEVLRAHPKVGDAALIGIPDERAGMVPAAAIEKRIGAAAPSAQELEDFLRSKLPAYKIPVRFVIVDELPRTESMKPRREGLRALFT